MAFNLDKPNYYIIKRQPIGSAAKAIIFSRVEEQPSKKIIPTKRFLQLIKDKDEINKTEYANQLVVERAIHYKEENRTSLDPRFAKMQLLYFNDATLKEHGIGAPQSDMIFMKNDKVNIVLKSAKEGTINLLTSNYTGKDEPGCQNVSYRELLQTDNFLPSNRSPACSMKSRSPFQGKRNEKQSVERQKGGFIPMAQVSSFGHHSPYVRGHLQSKPGPTSPGKSYLQGAIHSYPKREQLTGTQADNSCSVTEMSNHSIPFAQDHVENKMCPTTSSNNGPDRSVAMNIDLPLGNSQLVEKSAYSSLFIRTLNKNIRRAHFNDPLPMVEKAPGYIQPTHSDKSFKK